MPDRVRDAHSEPGSPSQPTAPAMTTGAIPFVTSGPCPERERDIDGEGKGKAVGRGKAGNHHLGRERKHTRVLPEVEWGGEPWGLCGPGCQGWGRQSWRRRERTYAGWV